MVSRSRRASFVMVMLFATLVVVSASSPVLVAQSAIERDFFYLGDEKFPLEIALDRIGVLAFESTTEEQIRALAAQRGLSLIDRLPYDIYILGLPEPRERRALVELTRDVLQGNEQLIGRAGLVTTPQGAEQPSIADDHFIARFADQVNRAEIDALNQANNVRIVMQNPFSPSEYLLAVSATSPGDGITLANQYHESPLTTYAHPDFIHVIVERETPFNDTLFASQWHHRNTGGSGGTPDADADTTWAWDITQGTASTVIAVIDDGFDLGHPDLIPNYWVNPGEVAGNGVDDDANGFVDDTGGWDFRPCAALAAGCGDTSPAPGVTDDHGTAVAGLAAARGNNALGVSGTCPNCQLMPLRNANSVFLHGLAFGYAQQAGAAVITNSWGYAIGTPTTTNVVTAINSAATLGRGGLGSVVLFAMNNGNVDDCIGAAPDISSLATVIAVSASSNQDRKVRESAFGNCMDLLAPTHRGYTAPFNGTLNIATTDRVGANGYNNTTAPGAPCPSAEPAPPPADARDYTLCFGGTSAATPITAGIVGLVLSADPSLTRAQVQQLLQDTTDRIQDSQGAYATTTGFSTPAGGVATHGWGRVNAHEAVRVVAPTTQGGRGGTDVFIRDNRLDWGNTSGYLGEQASNVLFEPTRGFIPHWQSVDIKVDAPPFQPPPTTSTAFDAFVDENPLSSQTNRVYVRVRNRGSDTATSVAVKLHWAFAGTGLPALPADFWATFPADSSDTSQIHPLGVQTVSSLAYSGSSVAGTALDAAQIVQFSFPAPAFDPSQPNPSHYCLFVVLDSSQDSVDPASRTTFVIDAITPNDNNITHRNLVLEDSGRSREFELRFFVRNPTDRPVQAILRLADRSVLQRGWKVDLDTFDFDTPFELDPGAEVLVKMAVTLPAANEEGELTVLQEKLDPDQQIPLSMGGITYRFVSAAEYLFMPLLHK